MTSSPQDFTLAAPMEPVRLGQSSPPPLPEADGLGFSFSGDGAAYFRIWIVNLLLSILTLGIYSAWGKVRSHQYLYGHTRFAGSSFGYHGKPLAILKGRALIFVVLLLLALTQKTSPGLHALLYLLLLPAFPWVVVMAMRFRLRNTSWRQMRFNFRASTMDAVGPFIVGLILTVLTLGIGFPYARHMQQRFMVNNAWFGNARFEMLKCAGDYYRVYFRASVLGLLMLMLFGFIGGLYSSIIGRLFSGHLGGISLLLLGAVIYLGLLLMWMSIGQVVRDGLANVMWNHVLLQSNGRLHRFESSMTLRGLMNLHASNALLTLLTLGLYYPFAKLRALRYRLEHLKMFPDDDLDAIRARPQSARNALGDAAADGFELDLGL